MKFVDLFGGIGGFSFGMERAGHECVWYNDIDKYATVCYNKNFKTNYAPTDIRTVDSRTIPEFDCICAGFPCQSFSIAGKRLGFDDTRGTLFFEIARIARERKPAYLFLENVKGLLSHDNGRTFETILKTLDELGYDVEWQVLNSKNFGVPQNRERVFIIGHSRERRTRQVFPIGEVDGVDDGAYKATQGEGERIRSEDIKNQVFPTIRATEYKHGDNCTLIAGSLDANYKKGGGCRTMIQILSHSPRCGNPLKGGTGSLTSTEHCFTLDSSPHMLIELTQGVSDAQRVYDSEGIAKTLKGLGGGQGAKTGLYRINSTIRRLTPTECERLQGFPDGWTESFSDTQRYKMLGNAVTVNVIEWIAKRLVIEK